MGEGIDAEEGEGGLGLLEFEVAEEELGGLRWAVGEEGGREEIELGAEGLEVEVGVGVEVGGVEEDEEGVGAGRGGGGEEAADGVVVEVDDAELGAGSEGDEVCDSVGIGL